MTMNSEHKNLTLALCKAVQKLGSFKETMILCCCYCLPILLVKQS